MSKVSSVLKSLARDWSKEGEEERNMAYNPVLERVSKYLPLNDVLNMSPPNLCVPGAGVGRLACELSALGYAVQGNEFSLYMLLASDFVLNGPLQPGSLQISPWLLESRNIHSSADPLRALQIPDVDAYNMIINKRKNSKKKQSAEQDSSETVTMTDTDEVEKQSSVPPDFSMAAGEFVSIYSAESEQGKWDGVVACFFLDASPSIVEYLQVIYQMLRPGGFLFHFGPLLWHWSGPAMRPDDKSVHEYRERYSYLDSKYLTSIDLSWDDVRDIMVNMGFLVKEASTGHDALYTADRKSMMNVSYRCVQFVVQKPLR